MVDKDWTGAGVGFTHTKSNLSVRKALPPLPPGGSRAAAQRGEIGQCVMSFAGGTA